MWWQWLRRHQERAPPRDAPRFDALIALGPQHLPSGIDRNAAAEAVREAVQAMPGAEWISVERHGMALPAGMGWIELHAPGSSVPRVGATWDSLGAEVERVVLAAIASLPAPEPVAPDQPMLATGGFAEGVDMRAFELPEHVSRPEASSRVGHNAQTDVDLLAALLGFVLPPGAASDAGALAEAVLARFGSFAAVLSASERDLRVVPGLGTHCIAAIKLLHDAALRLAKAGVAEHPVLADRERLLAYLHAVLSREKIEQFRIIFLDGEGRLMADEAQARGTVNHTPVYPREVVKRALELGAASLILVHNHPSGDPEPSREDLEMTAQVRRAAELLGVQVEDHMIVGNGRWTSLREKGLL